jgi:hypothetical protein
MGSECEELADEIQANVVGNVCCGLLMERFTIEVLRG